MKKRFGDRKDAKLIRNIDAIHLSMANIMLNRCDREMYFTQEFDLTAINDYLYKKNGETPEYKYGLFQVIVTIMLKIVTIRPKLNRFVANKNFYQRNDVSVGFIAKKKFSDDGKEGIVIIKGKSDDNIDTIHDKMCDNIYEVRNNDACGDTEKTMDLVSKAPRVLVKLAFDVLRFLDKHGWIPQKISDGDLDYTSITLANLGSIDLPSGYHHLNNWGTCSIMCVIGKKKDKTIIGDDGKEKVISTVELGFTVDDIISDGYYLSKTLKLIKKLFQNPELLELPLSSE